MARFVALLVAPLAVAFDVRRSTQPRALTAVRATNEPVEEFDIDRQIKSIRVFEGDYSESICESVTKYGREAIKDKGSFSLCIPGGSIVKALGGLKANAMDFTKVHVFFANERISEQKCYAGGLEAVGALIPTENFHGVGEGETGAVAAAYAELLSTHESIDNSGSYPSVDMILLGTGEDGHCGSLYPNSAEIKSRGQVVLPITDKGSIAVSMEFMCASKVALVSAAGKGRAPMVSMALSDEFGHYDCPAGMVDAKDQTIWFVDQESIAQFDAMMEAEADEHDHDDEDE